MPDERVAYTTMGFMKPALDLMGDSVADTVDGAREPLVTAVDHAVPMFVPG
jgi:hypothetical protein